VFRKFLVTILWNLYLTKKVKVIILGHQKSGTTVIAALLSRLSRLALSVDPLFMIDQGKAQTALYIVNNPNLDAFDRLCRKYPKLFKRQLIKDPDYVFLYPMIKKYYKNTKFVFVVRDPRDMIRSICNRLNLSGDCKIKLPTQSDMRGGNKHWAFILSGKLPERNNIANKDLNYIEHLAHRWNIASQIYLNNSDDITLVKYEDFLENKEEYMIGLATKLGVSNKVNISEYVDVQYQGKGNNSVDLLDFFGEKNLSSINAICGKYMREFDYC